MTPPLSQSLRQRIVHAGSWSIASHVLSQVIRLGSNIILSRLLFPEAFGVMAIVFVLMSGFALFSDLGISQSIIQNPNGEHENFLDTAWTIQILRGAAIFLLASAAALLIPYLVRSGIAHDDSVYANSQLPWVLAVFSLTALLQGIETTKFAVARRQLQIKAITQIDLLSQITALVVMLVWAFQFRNIWALVIGGVVSAVVRFAAGNMLLPGHRNRLHLDSGFLHELLHFGKWIFLLSIIGFLVLNGDRLLLGAMVDATQLGYYAIAYLMVSSISGLYSSLASGTIFPAISEVMRQRPKALPDIYKRFQLLADILLFGAAGCLFSFSDALVHLLYDSRYDAVAPILAFLAQGLIGTRYLIVDQYCLATGMLRTLIVSNFMRLFVLLVGLPIGYHCWGFDGALVAIVLSQFANWPVAFFVKSRFDLGSWRQELIGLPSWGLGWAIGHGLSAILAPIGWHR